jgi:hypothetical protein
MSSLEWRRQWRSVVPPGQGESEREEAVARVRAETDVVVTLKTWWPDGWDRGRRTAATARPRVGAGLRSVGHRLKAKL